MDPGLAEQLRANGVEITGEGDIRSEFSLDKIEVLPDAGTPAAMRLENAARFLDFVGQSMAQAAEQAREILSTRADGAGSDR